ncbi:MAG: hypothetical protein G01um101424_265 [Parcubacteria group bacterium Gr01-1014_24]|nr:MAG: hypothetical protein G01um101424_265 [Parcubacteria group bacterium Gr01-1014_24]
MIKQAINHFLHFHKGKVNIVLHILGFLGVFYSIYKLNWVMLAIFIVIVEIGHIYNHFIGIEKYDFRPRIIFWRVIIFILVLVAFFFISQ